MDEYSKMENINEIVPELEQKPDIGYLIGLGLIKEVYRENIISEKEYNGMVKTFTREYAKCIRNENVKNKEFKSDK
ncbi:hypothetical protein SAMN02745134_00355 [Clostridium acidisoli DSM 12555]|uniref:Uncharacterized protein n=1 Tax=Clostridium acidisoli DSM 12555 TaxID=1121291 RepID=A0A1W1X0X2_9CLOT|nr:hypothetical protein [Clostridium acidisoli]SMC17493.1 hypothetical protein SAMN02745134_00355 [Clostridium acidisoli DSM 12555]